MPAIYIKSPLDFRASTAAEFGGGTGVLKDQLDTINSGAAANQVRLWDIDGEFLLVMAQQGVSGTTQFRGFLSDNDANITDWIVTLDSPAQLVKMRSVEDFVLFEYTPNA